MDAKFTEALKEIVGEKYDEFPKKTLDMLSQLWDKATKQNEVGLGSDLPTHRNLTVKEIREIRDCLLEYANYPGYPKKYPLPPGGSVLEKGDPLVQKWQNQQERATARAEKIRHLEEMSIPVVAPLSVQVMADASGYLESQGHEVLLWVMNPRDFVDIQKEHLIHHASGAIKLFDSPVSPVVATLWDIPVVKTNEIWAGNSYLVGCNADPVFPDQLSFTMLNGRHLRFVQLSITR